MITLVQIPRSATSTAHTASLVADYVAFDTRRRSRRQYQKAFGGLAIIVALGALFGRVNTGEAAIVDALLLLPMLTLAVIEVIHWHRLVRRLARVRAEAQSVRKS
jgi:hypothetical protein